MERGREAYLVDAAERERPRSLLWLQDEWRDVKRVLDSVSEDRNYCRSDYLYDRFSGDMIHSNFRRIIGALDYMDVLPAVNSDSTGRNQYDLMEYDGELLESIGKELQDRDVSGFSQDGTSLSRDLEEADTLAELG